MLLLAKTGGAGDFIFELPNYSSLDSALEFIATNGSTHIKVKNMYLHTVIQTAPKVQGGKPGLTAMIIPLTIAYQEYNYLNRNLVLYFGDVADKTVERYREAIENHKKESGNGRKDKGIVLP